MKKSIKILGIVLCVILIIYFIMFFSTNKLVNDVENIMLGRVPADVTEGKEIHRYNNSAVYLNAEVDVSITRLFVVHNFSDGYMWVKYSYVTKKNDKDILPSSVNVISRWKIHRENGKWEIVEIVEEP